jgi:hypothetical protein
MDGTKTTTNWIIAGLVALVVIIGGGWLIARDRSGSTTGANATSTETVPGSETSNVEPSTGAAPVVSESKPAAAIPTSSASGETITVLDQPAGANVIVAEVNLTKPSWVAVRDTRGWYPGAAWFSGSQKSVVIPLMRNTEAGQSYEVVIFIDNGDKKFELRGGDTLLTTNSGTPVSATFKAK